MIIIIDSIDRVGKTTLANKLSERLNGRIYKHAIKNGDYSEMRDDSETCAMFALINLATVYNDHITIFDRFHLSNTIYGMLNRKYDAITSSRNFNSIDKALAELGDDVVLIKVNPTDINRSSSEHGSDLTPYFELFNTLFDNSKIKNKYEINYYGIDDLVEQLYNKICK